MIQLTFSILKAIHWFLYWNISILNKIFSFVSERQHVHSLLSCTYYGTHVPHSPYKHPVYRAYSSQQFEPQRKTSVSTKLFVKNLLQSPRFKTMTINTVTAKSTSTFLWQGCVRPTSKCILK